MIRVLNFTPGNQQGWANPVDFIVVVTFETLPEKHQEAFRLLDEYIDGFLRIQPGFIESRLNEREDGSGFLHFARWEKESDFRVFAAKAVDHPLLPAIRELDASANFYHASRHYSGPSD